MMAMGRAKGAPALTRSFITMPARRLPSLIAVVNVMRRLSAGGLNVAAPQEAFIVLFLLLFGRALRIERLHLFQILGRQVAQMPDEVHEFPGVQIIIPSRAPRRHPRQTHSVLDD